MQVVLNTHGLVLKVKDKVFHISAGDEVRQISPEQIKSIAVTAPCLVSSAAVTLAADADIPIYFFDRIGEARSCLRSPYFESLATLRRKQVYFSDSESGVNWVVDLFRRKTAAQILLLNYLKNRRAKQATQLNESIERLKVGLETLEEYDGLPSPVWSNSIMGWEGAQARTYWQAIAKCFDRPWTFEGRSRRPAKDPFNALVNYLYGMLYSHVEQAIFAAGLDPHLGVLHADEYDRPTLSYDLIEPFRPWVDRLIIEIILKNELDEDCFEPIEKEGYYLSNNGKRYIIPAFNHWMLGRVRLDGRQLKREAHIYRLAAELASVINESVERP